MTLSSGRPEFFEALEASVYRCARFVPICLLGGVVCWALSRDARYGFGGYVFFSALGTLGGFISFIGEFSLASAVIFLLVCGAIFTPLGLVMYLLLSHYGLV